MNGRSKLDGKRVRSFILARHLRTKLRPPDARGGAFLNSDLFERWVFSIALPVSMFAGQKSIGREEMTKSQLRRFSGPRNISQGVSSSVSRRAPRIQRRPLARPRRTSKASRMAVSTRAFDRGHIWDGVALNASAIGAKLDNDPAAGGRSISILICYCGINWHLPSTVSTFPSAPTRSRSMKDCSNLGSSLKVFARNR